MNFNMNVKKSLILVLLSTLLPLSGHTADPEFGISLGIRNNNADSGAAGWSAKGKNGFQIGALAKIPLTDMFLIRSGFLYTQRYIDLETTGNTAKLNLTYLDIPLTAMIKFSDFGGFFVGPVLSLVQSKECEQSGASSCSLTNVSSSVMPISLGVSFKFAPQMGGELVYETYGGSLSDEVKNFRSIGANFVFFFE